MQFCSISCHLLFTESLPRGSPILFMSQFYARNSTESVQKTVTNQYKNEKKQYGISTKRDFQEKRINSEDFLLKLGAFCPRARAKTGVPYFSSPHRPRQQNMLPAVGSRRQLKQPPFGTPCPCAAFGYIHVAELTEFAAFAPNSQFLASRCRVLLSSLRRSGKPT